MSRPKLDHYENFPTLTHDEVDEAGATAFVVAHPELVSEKNSELLGLWCEVRDVPMTLWNLEIAARDLEASLEHNVPAPTDEEEDTGNPSIVASVTDVLAHYVPGDDEQKFLRIVADDPAQPDSQRRDLNLLLKRCANAQRRALASPRPPGAEPKIVI